MRISNTHPVETFFVSLAVLLISFSTLSSYVHAQVLGDNTIYGAGASTTNSKAFIDASAFATSAAGPAGGNDFCKILSYIYSASNTVNPIPAAGAVIDARGIATGSGVPCATGVNPWPTSGTVPPTTVLLPPGGLFLAGTWQVPSGTHLIGERRTTNLNPVSGVFPSGAFMIQMGPSSCSCPASGCPPVVLEYLTLQNTGTTPAYVSGIDNECSGPGSYVDHIVMFQIGGVGIKVGANAAGSGPYTSINYGGSGYCMGLGNTVSCPSQCVNLLASTRGVHGITCTMKSTTATNRSDEAAIHVNGQNSLEDLHFEGFYDGVVLGDASSAAGSSVLNVTSGNGGTSSGPVINAIHICNPTSHVGACLSTATATGDVTISGVTNNTNIGLLIQDDVTSTSVGNPPGSSHEFVTGLYALGKPAAGGNSRFSITPATTPSPGTPTWAAAASASPSAPCPVGSVYSNTNGTTKLNTIYVCKISSGTASWVAVN